MLYPIHGGGSQVESITPKLGDDLLLPLPVVPEKGLSPESDDIVTQGGIGIGSQGELELKVIN
ncbi:hypothetical protein BOW51_10295 [Solemya velesiana gill symbiont]|uniref:Uncharacterized protein n=1 Tax=Solemya velesiana gill symbiont TaxID=1918948 RepID=A0A1T2KSE4_9GAMM|nr:hypothetical protein BOW51_10295 [Solemya velesiana gill symbiont]